MPSKREVDEAIGRARRAGKGGKTTPKPAADKPAGIHPPPGGWKGDVRTVKAGNLGLLRVGVDLAGKAAKNAERLNGALDIAKGAGAKRATEAEALIALIDEQDNQADMQIPPHLLTIAQVGVRLEHGQVKKTKTAQLTLEIRDTKPVDKRLRELERLADDLGAQIPLDVDEDKAAADAAGE